MCRNEDEGVMFVGFGKGHGQALVTDRRLGSPTGHVALRLWHCLVRLLGPREPEPEPEL